jgi:serine-threonine kinase receptor-associated protein
LDTGSFLGHKGCCWDIKLSSTGSRAISGSADFSAKVWDATDGNCLLTLPHNHIVKSVDLNNDGTKGVTGGYEKKLRLWDIEALLEQQAKELQEQSQANGESTPAPKASSSSLPSKEFLRDDGSAAHDGYIKSVIWDEVNKQIISAGEDKAVRFWDPETLRCVHTIKTEEPITSMERNHDEKRSISLTHGNTVEFIDGQR